MNRTTVTIAAAALFFLAPAPAMAGGVARSRQDQEQMLLFAYRNSALTSATFTGVALPARAFHVTHATVRCGGAASGAGTVTITFADGTNTCSCAFSCTATGVSGFGDTGNKRASCTGSCVFPPNASINLSATAGCATTQPTVISMEGRGVFK